jgi:hypothetical protein
VTCNSMILALVRLWPQVNHPEDGGNKLLRNVGAIYQWIRSLYTRQICNTNTDEFNRRNCSYNDVTFEVFTALLVNITFYSSRMQWLLVNSLAVSLGRAVPPSTHRHVYAGRVVVSVLSTFE